MLASTVQFSRNGPRPAPPPARGQHPGPGGDSRPAQRKPAPRTRGAGSLRTQQRAHPAPAPPGPRSAPRHWPGTRTSRARETGNQVNSQALHKKTWAPRPASAGPAPGAP